MSVSGDSSGGMYVISGLMPSTNYSFQVAAETSAGPGLYNDPIIIETYESECKCTHYGQIFKTLFVQVCILV